MVTGEISDAITNIIAFKSGGIEDQARSKIAGLMKQETAAFTMRRKLTVFPDLPGGILTAIGVSTSVYLIISQSGGANAESLGLIVLTLTYMFQTVRNVGALPELITTHDDLVIKIYPTLDDLTGEYEAIKNPGKPVPLTITRGVIDINQVNFSYPSRQTKAPEFRSSMT